MMRAHHNHSARHTNNSPSQTNGNRASIIFPHAINSLRINEIRGGGEDNQDSPATDSYSPDGAPQQPVSPQMISPNFQSSSSVPPSTSTEEYNTVNGTYGGGEGGGGATTNDPNYEYRETVEDRIDAWRRQQQVRGVLFRFQWQL
jgi:hypothetical protein